MEANPQERDRLAYAALLLERQLDSYEKLHAEEIRALREALEELKRCVLQLAAEQAVNLPLTPRKEEEDHDEGTT